MMARAHPSKRKDQKQSFHAQPIGNIGIGRIWKDGRVFCMSALRVRVRARARLMNNPSILPNPSNDNWINNLDAEGSPEILPFWKVAEFDHAAAERPMRPGRSRVPLASEPRAGNSSPGVSLVSDGKTCVDKGLQC